jgi:hypothetical protein
MNILLGDSSAKVGRGYIFKPTTANENLNKIGNGSGLRVVNFTTSENVIDKITKFSHRNINEFTLTLDGKRGNHIDQLLIDR